MTSRVYGGLAPTERRAVRRRRLLDGALACFGTTGFQRTTIPALCRTAGVTTVHFYEEFGTLEALLESVYAEIAETAFERVRAALRASDRTPEQRLRASHDAYFEYFTGDERRARIYAVEAIGVSPAFERFRRAQHEAFVAQGARAAQNVASAMERALDYRLVSSALSGAALALLTDWIFAETRPTVVSMSEHLTLLWMRVLDLHAGA